MNIPQANEIQEAIKINGIFNLPNASIFQITRENLMSIDIQNVMNNDLKLMIESAQVLNEQIRISNNRAFIIRDYHIIDINELEDKIKKINVLCNIYNGIN